MGELSQNLDGLTLIPITKTTDLLEQKTKPIFLQKKIHSENMVLAKICSAVSKCCFGLGINSNESAKMLLAEDIADKYSHESIEDIIYCLKKGRQGIYDFGHEARGQLTMIVFSQWMEKHLGEKADARKQILDDKYSEENKVFAVVDYELYKKKVAEKSINLSVPFRKQVDKYAMLVCENLGVEFDDLFVNTKKREIVDCRSVISNYMRNNLRVTNNKISEYWSQKK